MDPSEIDKMTEAALAESESAIKLAIVEGEREVKPGSAEDKFNADKARMMERAEGGSEPGPKEDPRQPPATPHPPIIATYPAVSHLTLADFRERIELCARHGVECYEDGGIRIKFSTEAAAAKKVAENPHVKEEW